MSRSKKKARGSLGSLSYGKKRGQVISSMYELNDEGTGNGYGVEVVKEYYEKKLKKEAEARKEAEFQLILGINLLKAHVSC